MPPLSEDQLNTQYQRVRDTLTIVTQNRTKLERIERKIDLLLDDAGIEYTE